MGTKTKPIKNNERSNRTLPIKNKIIFFYFLKIIFNINTSK
jgi:hypothetical protein